MLSAATLQQRQSEMRARQLAARRPAHRTVIDSEPARKVNRMLRLSEQLPVEVRPVSLFCCALRDEEYEYTFGR